MPVDEATIRKQFAVLMGGTGGIDSWITTSTPPVVFRRLGELPEKPLSRAQLNQLLLLSHEAGISWGFFRYYWLEKPDFHPYDVTRVPHHQTSWATPGLRASETPRMDEYVQTFDQLLWGFHRFYTDAMLYYGNIRAAFREWRTKSFEDLATFFKRQSFNTHRLTVRGSPLPLVEIPKDNRYLISEMACKSYGPLPTGLSEMKTAVLQAHADFVAKGGSGRVKGKHIFGEDYLKGKYPDKHQQLLFSADDLMERDVTSAADLDAWYDEVSTTFTTAREAALKNTEYYLSMVNDLDVYVATSMRKRQDFREMGDFCDKVFRHATLKDFNLRYFDPTISAADGHEDKGLIECLMVKCCKVLVYVSGSGDSYGKDAEAAMALSLGKPVIFYCSQQEKGRFFKDIHPLSRLINFESGVAVGVLVATTPEEVVELLRRIFSNQMEYRVHHDGDGYLRLKENTTQSTIRLQTNNRLLSETFWNYYQGNLRS